ncbi:MULTISPECIES: hypothetical protein [Thermomonosporaceae]|uniref:hypothetical protein n=1 Tax=Thermomonosporaceae TaxID=2012 RepID=UPI00255A856B|nr:MULTISPECIES: hypothetical protein [Thermomonosporaceae]MDL4772727.1 hypothetical protein [Actinomadura xylanilytica]
MRTASLIVGLAALTTTGLMVAPAYAAAGKVDGSVTAVGTTCTWTNATTSNTPPNTLTVDHTTISASCGGGVTVGLSNSPTVTFNDTAGTATSPSVGVTATVSGLNCGYSVSNLSLARQGTTRTYTGGPFTASKTSGSFLCPGTATVDSASFSFH